jgi:hypothetical protein|tara:strand:+ start:1282 stop:1800 length:519 start_codon:yes stop_codon:yes gene_type:complete
MPLVIGIDPGKTGAAVALDLNGFPVEWIAADHPEEGYVVKGSKRKRYVDRIMAEWLADRIPTYLIVIEAQQARPVEGRSSCLTTGLGWGLWRGVAASVGAPTEHPSPSKWTREMFGAAPRGAERKARSIELCRSRVPDLPLTWGKRRKPHTGLADAACLALWGLRQIRVDRG